jgi:GT2 family glycosyltransferase
MERSGITKLIRLVVVYGHFNEKDIQHCNQVEAPILIVDNNEVVANNYSGLKQLVKVINNHNMNLIAGALNLGLKFAFSKGFEHAILLDHDSYLYDLDFTNYIGKSENALVQLRTNWDNSSNSYTSYFTAGTIISKNIWLKLGSFDETFRIDSVDLEYSLRAKKHGIPFIKSDKRYLYHELGNNADKQGFFITPNYPIWRYKYQFVNTIKIIIRYPTDPLLLRLVARRAYYFLRIIILELPIKMLNR